MAKKLDNGNSSINEENQVSERFRFLWEQYTRVINLCITLSIGTLLIFANAFLGNSSFEKFNQCAMFLKVISLTSLTFIFCGLVFAILWRILSQYYMEREVFGKIDVIVKYLEDAKIHDHNYFFEKEQTKFKRFAWIFSQYACIISLVIGGVCFIIFLINFLWI